jgi:hypothetical protein
MNLWQYGFFVLSALEREDIYGVTKPTSFSEILECALISPHINSTGDAMKKILSFTVIMFCLLFTTCLIEKASANSSGQFVPMIRFNTCDGNLAINHFLYDKASNIMATVKDNCMKSPMLGSLNIGQTKMAYAEVNQGDNHKYIIVYDIASKTSTTIYDLPDAEHDDAAAYFDKNDKIIFNVDGTLKIMDVDGKNSTTIAEPVDPSHSFGMFWLSPDREKIIVVGSLKQVDDYHTGNYEILVMMNADGTSRQIIGEAYLGEWNQVAWKLDSKKVFFYHHIFNIVEGEYQGKTPQYSLIDLSGGTPSITDFSNLDGWKNKEENACFFTKSGNLLGFIDPKLYNGQTGALISVRSDVPTWTDAMLGIDNSGDIYFADLDGSNFRMFVEFPNTLTVNKIGNGTITSSPTGIDCGTVCSASFNDGEVVTLTAQPDLNSVFSPGWSGGACTGTGTCIATLNADTTVTATFTAVQAGIPKISVKPTSLNFGSLKTGSTSDPKPVTVKNTGKGSLIIDSISISGTNADEFAQTNTCGIISPGGSCTISVMFTPDPLFGKKSANITIASSDLKSPNKNIKLSGLAATPKISVSPKSVNFGSVPVGSSSIPKIVTIKNMGISDLEINLITITGTNPNEFSQTTDCSTVAKGVSCTITVTFCPASTGSKSATMSIPSNDPTKPIVNMKLAGKATAGSNTMVNYFPLEVGNKWIYSSFVQGAYRNDEIIGTEIINGITTHIKERIEPAPDNYDDKRWLAYDSSSVLLYRIWSNEGADPAIDFSPPVIENKLSPQVGDKWSFGIPNLGTMTYEVLSINDIVTVPAGTFSNCLKIMDTATPSSKIHIKHYAPEVGMIRNEQPGEWVEELVYTKIGPKTYGVAP